MCTTGMLKHGSRRFQVCYISANSSLFNEHITGQSNGKRYCNVWDRQTDRRAPVINAIRNPLWDAKQLGSATCSWTRCLVALLYFRHSSVTAIYAYLSLSPSLSLQRTSYQLVRLSCVLLSRPTICPSVRPFVRLTTTSPVHCARHLPCETMLSRTGCGHDSRLCPASLDFY